MGLYIVQTFQESCCQQNHTSMAFRTVLPNSGLGAGP